MRGKPRKGVAILGGGVAGMSAAHELAHRGFHVTVFVSKTVPGGKARSIFLPGTGTHGRRDLPGEHGFRFLPSFYKHLPDTMKRIPFGRRTVYDNLVPTSRTMIARQDPPLDLEVLTHFPRNLDDLRDLLRVRPSDLNIPTDDLRFLAQRMWVMLTTCKARRIGEYDDIAWWDFIEADKRSSMFAKFMGDIAVRALVALNPRKASTKTIGTIGLQLWLDHFKPGVHVDRLLNGPTHDAWIGPWFAHLHQMGVDYRLCSRVEGIRCQNDRIVEVLIREPDGSSYTFSDDYYIAALPVERMLPLVSHEMKESEPRLANLDQIQTDWMTGIQFFLDVDVRLTKGHLVMADSPWGLTAISQRQFWDDHDFSRFGDGRVDGILSVVVSNWDAKGDQIPKPARECTREEIIREVWEELKLHLNDTGEVCLSDSNLLHSYLADSCCECDGGWTNEEPLLMNTVGSWKNRPPAVTDIHNLFLASDYVQTHTDLATMESANEAARRAVNGILDASGSREPKCKVWGMDEPLFFEPFKLLDEQLFRRGLPHAMYDSGTRSRPARISWF